MNNHSLDRRRFVLGLITIAVSPVLVGTSIADAKSVLLQCELIPLHTGRMSFEVPSPDTGRLVLRTEADGYWLDQVAVTHGNGTKQVIAVGRRLLPAKGLELVLAPHARDPLRIDLRHTYLPFSSSQGTMELWVGHPGVLT